MKQKIMNILNHMIREGGTIGINSYELVGSHTFKLVTQLSEFGHETWLKFEPTGDMAMFRIEITHVFGYIDTSVTPEVAANQLLLMLSRNNGSFANTTAFVGVQQRKGDPRLYATLHSFHHFVAAWKDEEIAEALRLHFFDLSMGLVTKDASLTILKMFGE